jgi:hypothetical protein
MAIISACIVLHNIAITERENDLEEEDRIENEEGVDEPLMEFESHTQLRTEIINKFFGLLSRNNALRQ